MKKILILLSLILLFGLSTSCVPFLEKTITKKVNGAKPVNSTKKENLPSGTEYNFGPNSFPRELNENFEIVFVGNSLTSVGRIPQKFEALLKLNNKTRKIYDNTSGGYRLSQHLDDMKNGGYESFFERVDVVVLQEYGTFGNDTANSVKEIQKLFQPNTNFYFLITEFDIPGRITELKDVKNIKYIPSGYAHNLLLGNGFTYDQLHLPNDYHPNSLYGYIGALTVYSTILNTSCIGFSYDNLDTNTVSLIPGDTKEDKDKAINTIQIKVMEAIQANQSEYD